MIYSYRYVVQLNSTPQFGVALFMSLILLLELEGQPRYDLPQGEGSAQQKHN